MENSSYIFGCDVLGAVALKKDARKTTTATPVAARAAAPSTGKAGAPTSKADAAATRAKTPEAKTAAKAAAKKGLPREVQAQISAAASRLVAAASRLSGRNRSRKRKNLASAATKLVRVGQKAAQKATTVMGLSDATLAMHASVNPQELALAYKRSAVLDAVAKLTDNAGAVEELVNRLDLAGRVDAANQGQSIIDRANAFYSDFTSLDDGIYYINAPLDQWLSAAQQINSDAVNWLQKGQSILSATPGVAPSAAAAAAAADAAKAAAAEQATAAAMPGGGGGTGGDPFADEGAADGTGPAEEGAEPDEEAAIEAAEQYAAEYSEGDRYHGEPQFAMEEYEPATYDDSEAADAALEEAERQQSEETVEGLPFILSSELEGVSDDQWTHFVIAMRTGKPGDVSKSNALGMFEMRPRRLEDLDLMINLSCKRKNGHAMWVGDFVPPLTMQKYLTDPALQYRVFAKSMKDYMVDFLSGKISPPDGGRPADMSVSGALAVLHKSGVSGLKKWNAERFEKTETLYNAANGIF